MASWWEDLAAHQARGALLLADPRLDFLEVAHALAADDHKCVEGWLRDGRLRRAGDADRLAYEANGQARFQIVVVQPWVLAQELVGQPSSSAS